MAKPLENKPQGEGRYLNRVEQLEKWRQQHEASVRAEERLAVLSKFSFSEVDYSLLVQRKKWREVVLPDCNYMYDEAKKQIERRYKVLIFGRIASIVILMLVLLFIDNMYILSGGFILELLILMSLMITIKNRQRAHKKVVVDVTNEIDRLKEENRVQNEIGRAKLEKSENDRLRVITDLIEGQTHAIISRIEEVLNRVSLPFPLKIDVYVMDQLPFIKIWLPAKVIIPTQLSSIAPDGQITYRDKENVMINKQYLEVCLATIIQVTSRIYANIQSFDEGYLAAYVKNGEKSSCVLALKLTRQSVIASCKDTNGITAIQNFEGNYQWNAEFELSAVEEIAPPSWDENNATRVQSVHVNIMG